MSKPIKVLRKITVLLISIPVLIVGIILIPLPGPGLLICLLGLAILSLEFDVARKYRDNIFSKLKDIINSSREKSDRLKKD